MVIYLGWSVQVGDFFRYYFSLVTDVDMDVDAIVVLVIAGVVQVWIQ